MELFTDDFSAECLSFSGISQRKLGSVTICLAEICLADIVEIITGHYGHEKSLVVAIFYPSPSTRYSDRDSAKLPQLQGEATSQFPEKQNSH